MNNSSVIQINQLAKVYGGRFSWRRVEALKGVSFDVQPGEIFGLLGPNGAGKTTIVKILLGIVRRYQGQAQLLGFSAGDRRGRRRVGYLPENLRIPGHHNALSALMLYGQLSGLSRSVIRSKRMKLLEQVELAHRTRDSVRKYSKGMLQRLGLAQVLLHDPDVIFLDEPTDGLDPIGRAAVRQLLVELRDKGCTIFLNSHLLQEVEMICDRVAILHHGELKQIGRVEDLAEAKTDQLHLTFRVHGKQEDVCQALNVKPDASEFIYEGESLEWQSTVKDQSQLDQIIDSLRRHDISILEVTRRRTTLEDVFLKLIKAHEESS
jgi:ABC-2 type transport system ATP-binding protein